MSGLTIFVLRLFMAAIMIPHGVHKLQKMPLLNAKWRDKYGLPIGSVALCGVLEVVCGLAMLVGVFTSYAAMILAVVMLVGTYTSIWKEHEPFLSSPAGKGWDLNLLTIGVLATLIVLGDGEWSLFRPFL